jgi:hypothetical protein
MNEQPYPHSPDALWLRLSCLPAELKIAPFQSNFGETDEFLCHYRSVLIGTVVSQGEGEDLVINLLPKLNSRRAYPWPSEQDFERCLLGLLEASSDWTLRCERDCDQERVSQVEENSAFLETLARALAYCKGDSANCPSFTTRSEPHDA